MNRGRTPEVLANIGHWLDDFRAISSALKITEGLDRKDQRNREDVQRGLLNLVNTATIHLIRQNEESYAAVDQIAVLDVIDNTQTAVNQVVERGLPKALEDMAVRAYQLVGTVLDIAVENANTSSASAPGNQSPLVDSIAL